MGITDWTVNDLLNCSLPTSPISTRLSRIASTVLGVVNLLFIALCLAWGFGAFKGHISNETLNSFYQKANVGVIIFCCFAVIGQLMGVYGLLRSNAYCVISCMALYVLLIVGPVVNVFKLGYPILVFTPWNGLLWIVIWPYSKEVAGELVERRKREKAEQERRQQNGNTV